MRAAGAEAVLVEYLTQPLPPLPMPVSAVVSCLGVRWVMYRYAWRKVGLRMHGIRWGYVCMA